MAVKQYLRDLDPRRTPQSQPIPGREARMGRNEAGGYTFLVDDWLRLDRFLILGTAGGTYYSGERELTLENAAVVRRCIAEDGPRTVARIAEISDAGRAPKNDPAILALAMAAKLGDDRTRAAAYAAVPTVCRIGTHIFDFAAAVDAMGGWGRGARKAIRAWYDSLGGEPRSLPGFDESLGLTPEEKRSRHENAVAYQLVKYRQRNGWTHRDLLRLSHHPHDPLLAWAALRDRPVTADNEHLLHEDLPAIIGAFEDLQAHPTDVKRAVELISVYHLPWEAVPTELHVHRPRPLPGAGAEVRVNADPTWQPPRRRPAGDRRNLNVYLPDSLRARMDQVPAKINWSAVCQRAIETALEVFEAATQRSPHPGGSDASTVPFSYSD